MTAYSDEDAQRIADRGRDALLERLRPAFHETARQHADILEVDDDQIEQMIQRAADRADGLQWRRALAAVATEQLGMSLGEALTAPVVARAQELAGAPSYEEALAALGLEPVRGETGVGETEDGETENGEVRPATEPAHDAVAAEHSQGAVEDFAAAGEADDAGEEDDAGPSRPETLRLAATHLGGIATLEAGAQNLELRIGSHGLDIARKPGRVLGRLRWREIRTLEIEQPRGLRRRRRPDRAQLVIHTEHGAATFEIQQVGEDELRASLTPVVERYARR